MSKRQQASALRSQQFWGQRALTTKSPNEEAQLLWDQLRATVRKSPHHEQPAKWKHIKHRLEQILQEVTHSEINM